MSDVTTDTSSVKFVAPFVRPIGIFGAALMGSVGLSMLVSPGDRGGPAPLSQLIVGASVLLFSAVVVLMAVKGYALSVTANSVVAHGVRNRVIPLTEIRSVDVVKRLVRLYQKGYCLSFCLSDGSEYVYKNFNAGLSQSGKGYLNVVRAKDLIEQRIAEYAKSP